MGDGRTFNSINKESNQINDVENIAIKKYYVKSKSINKYVKALIGISWVCAALAAFISPLFAIVGIGAGYLASRRVKGIGKIAILTNIILAILNYILTTLFLFSLQNLFIG